MNSGSLSNANGNARVFRFLSYALVFLMLACGVLSVSSLIRNVLPDWHSGLIAGIAFFVVIDRLYTYPHLKSLTTFSPEWGIALGVQWFVIALLIRFLLSYADGLDALTRDLSLLARGDWINIFTPEYLISFLFALLVWSLTGQFLTLLDEIGLDLKWALSEEAIFIQRDGVPAHQRLVNLIFSLGIGLVVLTALTRINLAAAFSNPTGIPNLEWNRFSGAEAGTLLYFVFGLALLSLSRLMSLQIHWNRYRIPVSSANLTRQWGVYSLIFLSLLMVVISLLPSGDTIGFFSLLGTAFEFLFLVLYFIIQVVMMLVLILFSLLFLLFGKAPLFKPSLPSPPLLPRVPIQPAAHIDTSALLALLRSVLLWGALVAVILFALIHFVRQHESILDRLRRSRITNWLILAWQWLYRNAEKTRVSLSQAIGDGWRNILSRLEGQRILPRPGWINVRSLDPRQRIYFFYLAMIRRGAEQGLTRKPWQTPSEYAVTLEKALPTSEEDVDSITEAFIEARYSRRTVDSSKAELVKTTWGRIRNALQSKARSERSAKK